MMFYKGTRWQGTNVSWVIIVLMTLSPTLKGLTGSVSPRIIIPICVRDPPPSPCVV